LKNVPNDNGYVKIIGGDYHFVALHKNGRVVTWGDNTRGQLDGCPAGDGYVSIACGVTHSVALHENGSVITWGDMSHNQRNDCPDPEIKKFVSITCGCYHSIALDINGLLQFGGMIRKIKEKIYRIIQIDFNQFE